MPNHFHAENLFEIHFKNLLCQQDRLTDFGSSEKPQVEDDSPRHPDHILDLNRKINNVILGLRIIEFNHIHTQLPT